ncbi:MAG TPA: carboxypeptidase regulatory-like domain-containing protein [Steroidobacteraceae bacterium]|nr:carboxypeptidase regulatory-like domain-containing protein [Steroidobacteraceae bacterium]
MPADSDLTVNLDFPRGARLSGRITRGGEPFVNVPVGPVPPRDVQPSVYVNGTTTSEEGTYAIEDLPPGKYALMVERFFTSPIEIAGDTVFDFDVPGGQVSGRVLEAGGGEPIAGAQVFIWPVEPDETHRPIPYGSDEDGRFTLFGLEPGEFMVTVYKPGYEMFRKRISYESKPAELQVQLREERGVRVTARQAASGTPANQLIAIEVIGTGRGSLLRLQLDDEGTGYLPSALAGSTLKFVALGCEPTMIDRWNGDELDLELKQQGTR